MTRTGADASGHALYGDLAGWWPVISPPWEYADDAALIETCLARAERPVRTLLELGSGGGHTASHLKGSRALTLVDASPRMLSVSRALNPECEHVAGDMRAVRLGRSFDAVLIHDAVDYMLDTAQLRAAIETAFAHCRPGGVAVLMPDHTEESFAPVTNHGGGDSPDGRAARYLEWAWDPDPRDSSVLTEYVFVLREADGRVLSVHETHETGLFDRETWLRLMREAGFDALVERDAEGRDVFVGLRPGR